MTTELLMENLAAYSIQVLLVVAAAWALCRAFNLRVPRAQLAYWQGVLALCLLLPWVQPRRQPVLMRATEAHATAQGRVPSGIPAGREGPSAHQIAALLWIAGAISRLTWLGVGLYRLRSYRRRAVRIEMPSRLLGEAQQATGAAATFYISRDVEGPATFGILRSVVLLPWRFVQMDSADQRMIVLHELVHVRRRDWLATLLEELVRSLLWFHPAIWWLLARIQLAREQTVDRTVIEYTGERNRYVDTLLELAGIRGRLAWATPAPRFMRRRHFLLRMESIVKEVPMSKAGLAGRLAAMSGLLVAACLFTVWTVPLKGEPESAPPQAERAVKRIRVGTGVQRMKLVHHVPPYYPPEARARGIEGSVHLEIVLGTDGSVAEVAALGGDPLLIGAATEAVKQWRYQPTLLNGEPVEVVTQVDLNFPADAVSGGPTAATLELPGSAGQPMPEAGASGGAGATPGPDLFSEERTPETKRIRVGAFAQQLKLIYAPEPVYPPLAERARVAGTVRLHVVIAVDGAVKAVRVIGGHPLLIPAAVDAVKQWIYRPTLVDGEPVEVTTDVWVRVGMPGPEVVKPPATGTVVPVSGPTRPPSVLHKVEAQYTQQARDAGLEGVVVLSLEVGPDGIPGDIRVEKGLGLGLDENAVEALRQWRSVPAHKDGRPAPVRATAEVHFRLR